MRRRFAGAAAFVLAACTAGLGAYRLVQAPPDVNGALPLHHPAVRTFIETAGRFRLDDLMIVGMEDAAPGLTGEGLDALAAVTEALERRRDDGITYVRSLANVPTLPEGDDGAAVGEKLMPAVPRDEAGRAALKAAVTADETVYGALVSRDLSGYLVLVRAARSLNPARAGAIVRETVLKAAPGRSVVFAGGPFVAAEFAGVGADARGAWGLIALLAVMIAGLAVYPGNAARVSAVAGVAALLPAAVAAAGVADGALQPASALVAVASALLCIAVVSPAALAGRLRPGVAWAAAALFGFAAAALVGAGWPSPTAAGLSALTVCAMAVGGAALVRSQRPAAAAAVPRDRRGASVFLLVLAALGFEFAHVGWSPRGLLPQSPLTHSTDAFFSRHFGGRDVLIVRVEGDLRSPALLRRLDAAADAAAALPGVTDVRTVTTVLAAMEGTFGDGRALPASADKITALYGMLGQSADDTATLLAADGGAAAVHVRIADRPAEETAALVRSVAAAFDEIAGRNEADLLRERLAAALSGAGSKADARALAEAARALDPKALRTRWLDALKACTAVEKRAPRATGAAADRIDEALLPFTDLADDDPLRAAVRERPACITKADVAVGVQRDDTGAWPPADASLKMLLGDDAAWSDSRVRRRLREAMTPTNGGAPAWTVAVTGLPAAEGPAGRELWKTMRLALLAAGLLAAAVARALGAANALGVAAAPLGVTGVAWALGAPASLPVVAAALAMVPAAAAATLVPRGQALRLSRAAAGAGVVLLVAAFAGPSALFAPLAAAAALAWVVWAASVPHRRPAE